MLDWTFAPDWTDPVVERLEWMTEVIPARNGAEQRARLRAHPRRHLEYLVTAGYDDARVRLENLLIAGQGAGYMAPLWTDYSRLTASVPAGASTLQMPTTHRDIVVGDRIALVGDQGMAEAATVAAVAADAVTTVAPITRAWPAGAKVVPLRAARIAVDLPVGYLSDAVATTSLHCRFEAEQSTTPAAEAVDYRGYPVLLDRTVWDEDLATEFTRQVDALDSETGRLSELDATGLATVARPHRWVLESRARQAAFRAWLAARAGRLNPVWLPSGQRDVALLAGIGAATTVLNVQNRGHALIPAGAGQIGRRDIMIETHAGARYYRRIVDVEVVDADAEQITLDAPLGVAVARADVRAISFMRLVRLASDTVEIAHYTDELAVVQLSLISLRDSL